MDGTPEPGAWIVNDVLTTAESARLVDVAAVDRVLVHGSPPGEGRDLDLLVRPVSEAAISEALQVAGFLAGGHRLVRFRQGTCEQVELYPASWWDLPPEELTAVFDEAVPLPGYAHLVRPSPVHTLLILGRRVVEGVGYLDEKRRRYVEWAVGQDPKVWDHAAARADAWNGLRSIELLERLVGHGFVPLPVRARIIDDRLRATGRSPLDAHVETARQLIPRRRLPVVVSLSGLDGSGKSTQARMLVDAFNRIGVESAIEWAKLGEDRRLWSVRRVGVRLFDIGRRTSVRRPPVEVRSEGADTTEGVAISGSSTSTAWAAVVLASNVWTYRRQVRRYTGRVTFLVYDRYVLDSAVHLRWRYRVDGRAAEVLTAALVRLSPRPIRAFYLQMPPDAAQRRKMEDPLDVLRQQAEHYQEALATTAGSEVVALDGTRPAEELATTIAEEVWSALQLQGAARSRRWSRFSRTA
jgi:thymidylate kinase